MKKNKNRQERGKTTSNQTSKPITNQSSHVTKTHQHSSEITEKLMNRTELIREYKEDPIRLNRALIISGMGGVGKSSLIRHMLKQVADENEKAKEKLLMLKQATDAAQSIPLSIQLISEEKAEEKFLLDKRIQSPEMGLLNSELVIDRDILIEKSVELFRRELDYRRQHPHELHESEHI